MTRIVSISQRPKQEYPIDTIRCSYCHRPLIKPPSLAELRLKYPTIHVDDEINRDTLRCYNCERSSTHQKTLDIQLPPPLYKNPITKLEKEIANLQGVIAQGIEVEKLSLELEKKRKAWARTVLDIDRGVKDTWKKFWVIWGPAKGQERMLS
jgi:hypothetical protein